jgi:hypothetical protein
MSAGSLNLIADVTILAGASTSLIVSIDQQLRHSGRCFRAAATFLVVVSSGYFIASMTCATSGEPRPVG